MSTFRLLLFLEVIISCFAGNNDKDTVQLVITLFRHGDRTPDNHPTRIFGMTYPKDPYKNDTYFPYGNAELSNVGKKRMYKLGELFKKMYGSLLGPLYLPGLVDPLTTNFSRTECSLQAFLAGLFPPRRTVLEWNEKLNWNSIPYNKVDAEANRVLSFPVFYCPKFLSVYEEFRLSPEGKAIEARYKPKFPYLEKASGLTITKIRDAFTLYFTLSFQKDLGYKLPTWSKAVFPDFLDKLVTDNHILLTATPEINRLNGGFLLKKTINDIERVIRGAANQPKMYIYSAHELMVVSLLGVLKLYEKYVPYFGACVIIELHKIKGMHYVKVRYNTDNQKNTFNFADLTIPGCKTLCPIQKFKSLLQEHIPGDGDPCIE